MTTQEIIYLVKKYQEQSDKICAQYGCKYIHWEIFDIDPAQFSFLSDHYKNEAYKCGKSIAILLFTPGSNCQINLVSAPVKISIQYQAL